MAPSTYRLLLDARAAFPYSDPASKQTTKAWSKTPVVAEALALLPEAEQSKVLKFYFPKDAALSLASSLLKHYIITRTCGVPWAESVVAQDKSIQNGKPYFAKGGLEFNVSHHGEAAVLIASTEPGIKVGIDLTHVDMSKDIPRLRSTGFAGWVNVFESVFARQEVQDMLHAASSGNGSSDSALIKQLRVFYSYWALKEAYFKMTGDALLADWLQELAFSDVQPPIASETSSQAWVAGERSLAKASLRGQPIDNTHLELLALGKHYIVATSVTSSLELPPFEEVDVPGNIIPLASR